MVHLFIIIILVGVRLYLVVLICVSLMTNNVQDLFMWLLVICLCWRNFCSDPFPIIKLGCLFIIKLHMFFICILQMQVPYQIYDLQIFFPILWVVFSLP